MKRVLVAGVGVSVLAVPLVYLTSGVAVAGSVTPPPTSTASGVAAQVDSLVSVGKTSAQAGSPGSGNTSSHAGALEVGGQTVVGGDAKSTSSTPSPSTSGALVDTGSTPVGRVAVLPYQAKSSEDPGTQSSDATAQAALLELELLNPTVVSVSVLDSQSHAHWDGTTSTSTGDASSDGAVIDVGNGALHLVVLHSETSSSNGGSSYLVGINGTDLLTSKDTGGQCSLSLPSLLSLTCLTASGGHGAPATAAVANAEALGTDSLSAALNATSSNGGVAAAPAVAKAAPPVAAAKAPAAPVASPASGASLPHTGLPALLLIVFGAALIGAGATALGFVRATRRRLVLVQS
jgi:hypothetical protein